MRALANLIALILTLAIATVVVGWWSVPVVAGLWTLAAPRRAAVIYASFAGAAAWGTMLLLIARVGPVTAVDSLLAQIMNVPPHALIEFTVLYGALLAGSAALLAQSIRPHRYSGSREQGAGNRDA
jgi:hypothetical protein